MSKTEITKIRPAARIISTIGEDLVGDAYSAIVELVKNAYDADANQIEIIFDYKSEDVLKIEIRDNGHGMSTDTVLNKWLVPATKDKLDRRTSPNGRLFQGRKGIGRYAAAILGQELIMNTVFENKQETEVLINWELFEEKEFLDDIEIIVDSKETDKKSGTILFITASKAKKDQWGQTELARLTKELRKLKSPFKHYTPSQFDIKLAFFNCPFDRYNNQIFEIEAFPIIEFFDYKISGTVDEAGNLNCTYENNSEPNLPSEKITSSIKLKNGLASFGPIQFDLRVFDRDSEAIGNLINKGLIDPISGLSTGKNEAKRMLDEVYGINLYREGFRINPYGNGGIDWLDLDKNRIQNPSFKIGNNQIVGFVNIKPEEISHLEEKSARDGLKETPHYFGLVETLKLVLIELEGRRFNYRKKTNKGRRTKGIQEELNELFDYDKLTTQIKQKLSFIKVDDKTINDVTTIIQKEAERKIKLLENIQNTIAIYQGQATLGKIVTVLLHEGRKPVNYFKQQSPNLVRWIKHYKAKRDWGDDTYDDIVDRLNNFKEQSDFLAQLFKRLDPLAKQTKGEKKDFNVSQSILKAKAIFEGILLENNIDFVFIPSTDIIFKGWEEDLIIALTNLIENSIYWLKEINILQKKIQIEISQDADIIIHYKDNGPGIDKASIESGAIFEPGFSKKLNGTGLGLPIAGESIERLGGHIVAHFSESGAYFTIELKT